MRINLEEIKAREAAATKGPWKYDDVEFVFCDEQFPVCEIRGWGGWGSLSKKGEEKVIEQQTANGQFIAHSRQDIPDLIAEVERLTEINDMLKRGLLEDGDSAQEHCCTEYKQKLNKRIEELQNELNDALTIAYMIEDLMV